MKMPGFTAKNSLYHTSGYYCMVEALDARSGHQPLLPQAINLGGFIPARYCWIECYPIIIYNPDTKTSQVEYHCVVKCEEPILT
jgi:hypothetical protein